MKLPAVQQRIGRGSCSGVGLVELLRCDAGAGKAMEAIRGTARNQRENHGKDWASILDGLTVGDAVADGVRVQLGSFNEDGKRLPPRRP